MRTIKHWQLIAVLALLVGFWQVPHVVHAATGASFTVTPQLTHNKTGADTGYFNLKLAPGQQETLTVRITNLKNKAKTLRVTPTNAWTTSGGQLSYAPSQAHDDSTQYQFTKLLTNAKPQLVKLPANSATTISYQVTMPRAAVRGQILGGLRVLDTASYGGGKSGGMALVNRFAMVIAVQLQNDPAKLAPQLKLRTVRAGVQDNRAAVLATVQNTQPRLFNHLKIAVEITNRRSKQVVLTRTTSNMTMAPNSHFDYATYSNQALAAGEYTLTMTATAQQWRWHFTRDFSVTGKQAASVNKKTHAKTAKRQTPWLQILIGVLTALVVFLLGLLVVMRRRVKAAQRADGDDEEVR